LIQIWRTRFVDEHAVTRGSRESLKRQGNQIAEPSRRHCILARKKPIVGSESDIGDTFHRVSDKECPETPRRRCWYRFLEKNPGMSTVSGSRPLNGNGNFVALAGLPKSEDISSLLPFVEICSQERTGVICKHRIDTQRTGRHSRRSRVDDVRSTLHLRPGMPDLDMPNI
jgi:hypothetical protein